MELINICEKQVYLGWESSIEKKIKYNLCISKNNEGTFYGIQIETECNNERSQDIIENISCDKEAVLKIIDFLNQNGVDDICFRDVIEDLKIKIRK